jgi:hypothetical protein
LLLATSKDHGTISSRLGLRRYQNELLTTQCEPDELYLDVWDDFMHVCRYFRVTYRMRGSLGRHGRQLEDIAEVQRCE